MDTLSDQLQSKVLRNLVDLTDFRNCRLVSQNWKRIVMEACRNKFHVVYPLTDSTLYTASELKDALVSFDVYAFTGEENKDAWPTSGIEALMQTTEWIQFSGSKVSTEEIRKILRLAHDSLKTLSFKCLKNNLMHPLLEMQETFSVLRKLSIGYYNHETYNGTFNAFTDTLEKWNNLDCRVQLPLLESLNLYFDGSSVHQNTYRNLPRRTVDIKKEDLFRNYIAISKLLLKYKKTLKEVQIERAIIDKYLLAPRNVPSKWTEMERGLEALDELNLKRLKVSNNAELSNVGIEVLGRPMNLKRVLYNSLICPCDSWNLLIAMLSHPNPNNIDCINLTSIKINLAVRTFPKPDPTMAINLGGLRECINLRTLWFIVNIYDHPAKLFVKNVELLPRGISTLRFESTDEHLEPMGYEALLNERQIRWIIDNLRELECARMSLLIPEETNEQREVVPVFNHGNNGQPQQHQEDINRLANINLDIFRELIAMPNLKDLKVDMMKAPALNTITRQDLQIRRHMEALFQRAQGLLDALVLQVQGLAGRLGMPVDPALLQAGAGQAPPVQQAVQAPPVQHAGQGTTLDAIRQYSNLCEAAGYTTTTTTSTNFGANEIFGFATLTIQRNHN